MIMQEICTGAAVTALFAFIIGSIIYNCINARGRNKTAVLITNGVLLLFIIGVPVFSYADGRMIERRSGDGHTAGDALFYTIRYENTTDGYHIFHSDRFIAESIDFAVPEKSFPLPPFLSKSYPWVIISFDSDTDRYCSGREISVGGQKYLLGDRVTGIYTNYFDAQIIILLFSMPALLLFNIVEFIVIVAMKKKRPDTDERSLE